MMEEQNFIDRFFEVCREKGIAHEDVYKAVDISRQCFHKICKSYLTSDTYEINRNLAIAFGLALNLNLEEMKDFLSYAGYAFSPVRSRDKTIMDLVGKGKKVNEINDYLANHHFSRLEQRGANKKYL